MTTPVAWSSDAYLEKASLYFSHAEESTAHGPELSLWVLLGFEHLSRAALAKASPTLLASPDSILDALGYGTQASEAKTVLFKTVVERLRIVIDPFTEDCREASLRLAGLRNREVHTAEPVLVEQKLSIWIPDFYSVAVVLCDYLDVPIENILGKELETMSSRLLAESDSKLIGKVKRRIADARKFVAQLSDFERELRIAELKGHKKVRCPACGNNPQVKLSSIRTTAPRWDEDSDDVTYTEVEIVRAMECNVCGLTLDSLSETRIAGLTDEIETQHLISASDRYEEYVSNIMDYDYQNE